MSGGRQKAKGHSMEGYQVGKDIQDLRHRLEVLEKAIGDRCEECQENEPAPTAGSLSVRSIPLSGDTYALVIKVPVSSPLASLVQPSMELPFLDSVSGGARIIVALGTPDNPVKPGDFITAKQLVLGRGWYKKRRADTSCSKHIHNEDCVDCGAYTNRVADRESGACGYYAECIGPQPGQCG